MESDELVPIGVACERFGITGRTIRWYEERGLISPGRDKRGDRTLDAVQMARLAYIFEAQKLGFTLSEIGEMLGNKKPDASVALTINQLQPQLDHLMKRRQDIDRQIKAVRALLRAARRKSGRGR